MSAGFQVINTNNSIIIDENYTNMTLNEVITFSWNIGQEPTCNSSCTRIRTVQAAGAVYNPACVFQIALPYGTRMCSIKPLNDVKTAYEVCTVGHTDYVIIKTSEGELRDGKPWALEIHTYRLWNIGAQVGDHWSQCERLGLQVFRDDGSIAFDALNNQFLHVEDVSYIDIHMSSLVEGNYETSLTLPRPSDDALVSYAFFTAPMYQGGTGDGAIHVTQLAISKKDDRIVFDMLETMAQGSLSFYLSVSNEDLQKVFKVPILTIKGK